MTANIVDCLSVVLLLAQDTAKTGAFYRDVLGLTLAEEEHGGRHRHYACRLGSVYFTIQPAVDLVGPDSRRGYDFLQLCFTVVDLEAFAKHLQEMKITPLHAPRQFEGTTYVTVLDPDGRHVRLMTPWKRES